MKYRIETSGIDEYKLIYTSVNGEEVTKTFKRNVKLANKVESATPIGRAKLAKYLTERGETKKDYEIIVKDKNGNTTYDESNYNMMEKAFIETAQGEILLKIIEDNIEMNYDDLLEDMGAKTEEDAQTLTNEIIRLMLGRKENDGTPYPKEKGKK